MKNAGARSIGPRGYIVGTIILNFSIGLLVIDEIKIIFGRLRMSLIKFTLDKRL
jgi:hypothetical protein